MLFEEIMEPCVRISTEAQPDGQGGWVSSPFDTDEFRAAIVLDVSKSVVVASSDNMERTYTVTCPVGTGLSFHETFKRLSDGQRFRVTSAPADKTTPGRASFQFEQVRAEAIEHE